MTYRRYKKITVKIKRGEEKGRQEKDQRELTTEMAYFAQFRMVFVA